MTDDIQLARAECSIVQRAPDSPEIIRPTFFNRTMACRVSKGVANSKAAANAVR